jgi:hypothetical protein
MIGDIVAKIVQDRLVSQYGMVPIKLPNTKKGPSVTLFSTREFLSKSPAQSTALILIQGLGQGVKAGLWSRSVAINEGFTLGTMLPLVEDALKCNMAILIMNPNQRLDESTGQPVPESSKNEAHALTAWETYVKPSKYKKLAIVAHSFGGKCVGAIYKGYQKDF